MSAPPPRPPTSASPTRQQIDELEALMHRMLALPLAPLTDDPGAPPTRPAAEVPRKPELRTSAPAPRPEEIQAEPPPPEFILPAWPESSIRIDPPRSAASSPTEEPDIAPPPAADPAAELGPWLPAGNPPTLTSRRSRRDRHRPRIAPWRHPVLWSNRTFDRWTLRLGSPGRWLRGPQGRALLGWTGLLLLAAALAWGVLDWIGWTW